MPIFFKLWFGFCFMMALALLVSTVMVLLHPQWIGEFAGQMVTGYQTTVNPSPAAPHVEGVGG